MPFSSATFQCLGDPIADLTEDMAAEQKARITYDNILRLVDDPEVRDGPDDLHMGQLLGADVGKTAGHAAVGHGVPLVQVPHRRPQLPVGAPQLADDQLVGSGPSSTS